MCYRSDSSKVLKIHNVFNTTTEIHSFDDGYLLEVEKCICRNNLQA